MPTLHIARLARLFFDAENLDAFPLSGQGLVPISSSKCKVYF